MPEDLLFAVTTRIGFTVQVSKQYWEVISTIKHPILKGREYDVKLVLEDPEEIRKSKVDPNVYMFYRLEKPKRWLCAVVKKLNGEGFLITAYPTDSIKEGENIWSK